MRVLRVEHKYRPRQGVYTALWDTIHEHHPSGVGWGDLPNVFADTNHAATWVHVCACRSLAEFTSWWPDVLLHALRSTSEVRIVVLAVRESTELGVRTVIRGRHQTAVHRDACEEVRAFTVQEFLSLSVRERRHLFNDTGDYNVDEQQRTSSYTRDHDEEPRGSTQRFAREALRASAQMREPVQTWDACDFQGAPYRSVNDGCQDFTREAA